MGGLSQAQGALYNLGCGLLHPSVEKGPQVGKMPFPHRPGGGGHSLYPTPTLICHPAPSQNFGSSYSVFHSVVFSSSEEVQRLSNSQGWLSQVSCSVRHGHP